MSYLEYFTIMSLVLVLVKNIYTVKKNNGTEKKMSTIVITFWLITIFLLLPVLAALLVIFMVYRAIINLFLKLKYGRRYVGLVQGSDAVHTIDIPLNSITCVLIIFEYDHTTSSKCIFDILIEVMTNYVIKNLKLVTKLQSTYLKFMGYSYMLNDNLEISECCKKMKLVKSKHDDIDESELIDLLTHTYNSELPKGNTILWDFLIGTQSIKWKDAANTNIKYYPALFRIHHCVADGVALLKLLVGVLADKTNIKVTSSNIYKESLSSANKHKIFDNTLTFELLIGEILKFGTKITKIVSNTIQLIVMIPSSIFVNLVLRANDSNFMHKQNLAGESIIAFYTEKDDTNFQKIKQIKQKIPGTSFPEILLTAISASLYNYFEQKSSDCPEYTTSAIPLVSGSSELQYLSPGTLSVSETSFYNNYSLVLLDLPLFIKARDKSKNATPLIDRLNLLKKQINILNNSIDYQVNYILMNVVFSILPQPLVRFLLKTFDCTTTVSIMPGPCKLTYSGGLLDAVDTGFWVPHLKNIGVSFSVFTYDRRLFVGISVDKALIDNHHDAQDIINGVIHNIGLLQNEVVNFYK